MPSTPTYGLPYPALSDSPNGPVQIKALADEVEVELTRIDARIATDSSLLSGFAPVAQTGSGALAVGASLTVASLVVSDPGFAYHIVAVGSCGWTVTAAAAPGNLFEGAITIDSAVYNVNRISAGYIVSASIGASFTQGTLIVPMKRSDSMGTLTGAHTARLIVRNTGGTAFNVGAAGVDTSFMVRIVRA